MKYTDSRCSYDAKKSFNDANIKTIPALLALSEGNPLVTRISVMDGFSSQRTSYIFLVVNLNKLNNMLSGRMVAVKVRIFYQWLFSHWIFSMRFHRSEGIISNVHGILRNLQSPSLSDRQLGTIVALQL